MAKTEVRSEQLKDGSVGRDDLNAADTGKAVVRKIIAGTALTLGSTGPDAGTGDVTVNLPTTATPQLAKLGLGQAADSSAVMAATGQYFSTRQTTTTTLDWNNGNCLAITLANNDQTFTFANPKTGGRYLLELKQPASGAAGTVTWPSTVKWAGGTTPTLTATNGRTDIVTLYYNGTNYAASISLDHAL